MGLSEIAAGIEVTAEQDERGVATVDDTETSLVERLAEYEDDLPCTAEATATILESHSAGTSVGESAREAGIAPMTAAKALYRCGVAGVCPLGPTGREIVADWVSGEIARSTARELTDASEADFALTAYIETHEPIPELSGVADETLGPSGNAAVAKRDELAETMSSVDDLL
jgi:hypothetical protein